MTPSKQPPSDEYKSETEANHTIVVVIDGPGDKTRRPRRPSIPRTLPELPPSSTPEEGNMKKDGNL